MINAPFVGTSQTAEQSDGTLILRPSICTSQHPIPLLINTPSSEWGNTSDESEIDGVTLQTTSAFSEDLRI